MIEINPEILNSEFVVSYASFVFFDKRQLIRVKD